MGDGAATNITTAFGNIIVTRSGASGSSKGVRHVYSPDEEPFISNSGDLTRDKIAKLVEMAVDNAGGKLSPQANGERTMLFESS